MNKNQTGSGQKETLSTHATDEDSLYSSNDTSEDLYNSLHCSTSVEECVNVTISSNVEDEQHQQVEQHGQDETMNCAETTSAFDEQFDEILTAFNEEAKLRDSDLLAISYSFLAIKSIVVISMIYGYIFSARDFCPI